MNYDPYIIPKSVVDRYNELAMQTNLLHEMEAVALLAAFPFGLDQLLQFRPSGGVIRDDKMFISIRDGVLIIPRDKSYWRFISNTWYDNINTDEL